MSTPQVRHPIDASPAVEIEPGATQFVWIVVWSMLTALLLLIAFYDVNIPIGDEWDHTPVVAGVRPVSLSWLWAQEVNHRFPVAKLIWILSLRLSDYNFHLLMFLDLLALAALSSMMVFSAKRIRGRISYSDAFFPLIILNPAQWENLYSGFQVQFVIVAVLSCLLLMIIVFTRGTSLVARWRTTAAVSFALLLLPISTAAGLPFAAVFSLWFGFLALTHLRSGDHHHRRRALTLFAGSIACVLEMVFYFRGYVSPDYIPRVKSVGDAFRAMLEFLGVSFGRGFATPYCGWAVLLLMITAAAGLVLSWRKEVQDRWFVVGLFVFLGATAGLAASIGQGRGGFGPGAGLASRYVTLAIPVLACLYCAFQMWPSPGFSRSMQVFLFAGACAALPLGLNEAIGNREGQSRQMQAFEKDVLAGMPPALLLDRYRTFLNPNWTADTDNDAIEYMRMLHHAGVGVFRSLKDVRNVSIPASPVATNQAQWANGVGTGSGKGSSFDFALAKPQQVAAIRLKYVYEESGTPASLQVSWKETGKNEFDPMTRHVTLEAPAGSVEGTITASVNDRIDQFRIEPDTKPFTFRLLDIALLLAPEGKRSGGSTSVTGMLDVVESDRVAGWAWDRSRPDAAVEVELYDGSILWTKVTANQLRADLRDAHLGNGQHGFEYKQPLTGNDGGVHIIRAFVAATDVELASSPKSFLHQSGNSAQVDAAALPSPSLITAIAAGSVDRLNDAINPNPLPNEQHPFALGSNKKLTILGWLIDRPDGKAFDEIYAVVNGRRIRATVVARPDVAAFFKNPALTRSGFSVSLTGEDLGKGIQKIDLIGRKENTVYRLKDPLYVDAR